jgi:aspartate racemase
MTPRSLFDRTTLGGYPLLLRLTFVPCSRFHRLRHVPDLWPARADVSLFWFCVRIHERLALPVGDKNNRKRGVSRHNFTDRRLVINKMKTLGIIGGLGPESTLDYYQRIIALYRERTGDRHYPEFVIVSVDLRKGLDFMDANDLSGMANYLLEGIDKLARAGADFGIISANTPHIVFDEVAPKSPIPLISIVEATRAAAKAQNLKRLALFGTRYTMRATFYPKVFARDGIELLVPDSHGQDYIHDKYMNELVPGRFLADTRAGLLTIVDRMKATSDIDGVILAGTELPLILRDPTHNGIPFLDTTKIHVEAAVAHMLS